MHRSSYKCLWASLYSLAAILLTLLGTSSVRAQNFRGAINGVVTDRTGAVIANASVNALQTHTESTHTTISSSAGEFSFQDLPLGLYSVTVSFSGFQTVKTDKITVSPERSIPFPSFFHSPVPQPPLKSTLRASSSTLPPSPKPPTLAAKS
jgi:hypothetical protein